MIDSPKPDLVAIDIDTGKILSPEAAIEASDNPFMYRWVRWVSPVEVLDPLGVNPVVEAPVVVMSMDEDRIEI